MLRLQSFLYALSGLNYLFKTQAHAKIHAGASLLVLVIGFFFHISLIEWCVVLGCIAWVISLEALNTAIETLCDTLHPSIHPGIKKTKDIAAGAVLFSAFISACIAGIIFFPKGFAWLLG